MQKVEFRIEKIAEMDDQAAQMINIRFADLVKDLIDKPLDDRARKLTLTFEMKPRARGNYLADVELVIETKISVPSDRSMIHTLVSNRGQPILMFEPLSRDDPNQRTFETLEQDAEEERARNLKMSNAANA